jgi:hypothetical protein
MVYLVELPPVEPLPGGFEGTPPPIPGVGDPRPLPVPCDSPARGGGVMPLSGGIVEAGGRGPRSIPKVESPGRLFVEGCVGLPGPGTLPMSPLPGAVGPGVVPGAMPEPAPLSRAPPGAPAAPLTAPVPARANPAKLTAKTAARTNSPLDLMRTSFVYYTQSTIERVYRP